MAGREHTLATLLMDVLRVRISTLEEQVLSGALDLDGYRLAANERRLLIELGDTIVQTVKEMGARDVDDDD